MRLKFSQADAATLLCDPALAHKVLANRDLSPQEIIDLDKTWDAEALFKLCGGVKIFKNRMDEVKKIINDGVRWTGDAIKKNRGANKNGERQKGPDFNLRGRPVRN